MASLIAIFGANIAPFVRGLNEAKAQAAEKGAGIAESLGTAISSRLAGIATLAGIAAIAKQAIEMGDHFEALSARTGISMEDLQRLDRAAKMTSGTLEDMVGGIERLATAQARALSGDKKAMAALTSLGMTDSQIQNTTNLLGSFLEMGERIRGMEISGEMESALRDVFGRSGAAFIAPFKLNLKAEFEGASGIISEADMARLAKAHDLWVGTKESIKGTFTEFGVEAVGLIAAAGKSLFTLSKQPLKDFYESIKMPAPKVRDFHDLDKLIAQDIKNEETAQAAKRTKWLAEEKKIAESAAREKEKLEDDLERKREAAALAAMTREERIIELERRRARLVTDIAFNKTFGESEPNKILKDQVALAELDKDLAKEKADMGKEGAGSMKKAEDEERKRRLDAAHRLASSGDQLSQIGGFLGNLQTAPELAMLDLTRQNEKHLAAIQKALERKAPPPITTSGVNY